MPMCRQPARPRGSRAHRITQIIYPAETYSATAEGQHSQVKADYLWLWQNATLKTWRLHEIHLGFFPLTAHYFHGHLLDSIVCSGGGGGGHLAFATFLPRQRLAADALHTLLSTQLHERFFQNTDSVVVDQSDYFRCAALPLPAPDRKPNARRKQRALQIWDQPDQRFAAAAALVLENRPVLFCHMIHRSRDSPVTEHERPSQHFTFQSQQEALE